MHRITYQKYLGGKPKSFKPARFRSMTYNYTEHKQHPALHQPARLYDGKYVIPSKSSGIKNESTHDFIKENPIVPPPPPPPKSAVERRKNLHSTSIDRVITVNRQDSEQWLKGMSGKRFENGTNMFRSSLDTGLEKEVSGIDEQRAKSSQLRYLPRKRDHLVGSTTIRTLNKVEMKEEFTKASKPRRKNKLSQIFYSGQVAEALNSARFGTPKCLLSIESPCARKSEKVLIEAAVQKSPHVKKSSLGKNRAILGNQVIMVD